MNGGADREKVIDVIAGGCAISAEAVLRELEMAGYAVVRAGQVPRDDELTDVQDRMAQLGRIVGNVQHDSQMMVTAANKLAQLRTVAEIVLGLDLDDVDEATS